MIMDHDLFKSNPASGQSRFHVRNPHVTGAVLMHLEEILEMVKKPDSVQGLPRFIIGHFLPVCNKVAPEGLSQEQLQHLLLEDPDYFNDLTYDDIVTASCNILCVADALFPYFKRRDDEIGPNKDRFSEIRGIHTMEFEAGVTTSFQTEFNSMVDQYRAAKASSQCKASLLSKDKTKPLQFIPGIHVFEHVLSYLLTRAGVPAERQLAMSGEDIVRAVATLEPQTLLSSFLPSAVPASASQHTVDAAFALSSWFQKVYHFTVDAEDQLIRFRGARESMMALPTPTATAFASLLEKVRCRVCLHRPFNLRMSTAIIPVSFFCFSSFVLSKAGCSNFARHLQHFPQG